MDWWTISANYVLGCARRGPECDNCFAIRDMLRELRPEHRGLAIMTPDGPDWTGIVRIPPGRLEKVERQLRKPHRPRQYVIVTLHGDLFYGTTEEQILDVVELARRRPEHVIMSLTKRPDAQRRFFDEHECPENLWLGTSVGTQKSAERRLPELVDTRCAVPFVSFEPVLEAIDATPWLPLIRWSIVGGESGPGAREMRIEWARSLRDQCVGANVPLWFKQYGDIRYGMRVGRKCAGNVLDGRRWLQRPDGTDLSDTCPLTES